MLVVHPVASLERPFGVRCVVLRAPGVYGSWYGVAGACGAGYGCGARASGGEGVGGKGGGGEGAGGEGWSRKGGGREGGIRREGGREGRSGGERGSRRAIVTLWPTVSGLCCVPLAVNDCAGLSLVVVVFGFDFNVLYVVNNGVVVSVVCRYVVAVAGARQ